MSVEDNPLLSVLQINLAIHGINKRSEQALGLSLVQWCLLNQLIDMPGTSAKDLARAVGVHPSTLTQSLKRLERKGLLFTGEDPKDSRKIQISLTKAGKKSLEQAREQMREWSKVLRPVARDLLHVKTFLLNSVP